MIGAPVQLFAVDVMVKVTVIGEAVALVRLPKILPLPLAAIPVTFTVLSLVQLKIVPLTLPDNIMSVILAPEQTVCDGGVATASGAGFTVTIKLQVLVLPHASVAV